MYYNKKLMIKRKETLEVIVWNIWIWWENPVRIQSMTNTLTADIEATYNQIVELYNAWSELVRITVNDDKAALAVPEIKRKLVENNIFVPIVWDFHYNWHTLLNKFPEMAKALDKLRINPGNVWRWEKRDTNFEEFIEVAIKYQKPVRIWVNWGSLDEELLNYNMEINAKLENPKSSRDIYIDTMVESAILSIEKAESLWLPKNMMVISVKMSDLQDVVKAYELLAEKTDCPLHVWLTEAWWMTKWIVASSTAMWILLQNWIWDTIRASVTPVPGQLRSLEVDVCKYLLQVMWIRDFQPLVTSCPGCWRTLWDTFQKLAKDITDEISKKIPEWKKKYKNFESTKIAVMWCIVNWVWEAKNADIWVYIPGNNEDPIMPVMVKWKVVKYLNEWNVFSEFLEIIEKYFDENFK